MATPCCLINQRWDEDTGTVDVGGSHLVVISPFSTNIRSVYSKLGLTMGVWFSFMCVQQWHQQYARPSHGSGLLGAGRLLYGVAAMCCSLCRSHTMDLLWEKFQWILPLYMKPISFQSKASVVCSVTAAIFIGFCLKKVNVFSQHIGKKTNEYLNSAEQITRNWNVDLLSVLITSWDII